jgi:hypothetical protein
MKKFSIRLLSLFMVMFTMSQQAHAGDFLRDFFNELINNSNLGPRVYSKFNAESIGAGKVYAEWATGKQYDISEAATHLTSETVSVPSPDDQTSHRSLLASSKIHKYAFFVKADDGWEFEDLYSDASCQNKYEAESVEQDGVKVFQIEIETSATSESNQPVLDLFARFALNLKLNKYGYSTLYYKKHNLTVPSGVTAYTYTLDSDKLVVSTTYDAGEVIPAGEAVVLKGDVNAELKFPAVGGSYTKDTNNLLKGSDEAATTEGTGKFYALSAKGGKVGFYWMADGGGAFECPAHKAYLLLPSSDVKSYAFDEDDATGIQEIEDAVEDGAIYNVAGQRLNKMQKGINIVNGKKILKK